MALMFPIGFSILSLIASYHFVKWMFKTPFKKLLFGDFISTSTRKIVPPPRLSAIRAILWFVFVGKFRTTRAVRYVGRKGKIIDVRFWIPRGVVINDVELGKQLFRNPIFCGRETNGFWQHMSLGSNGLINSSGKKWLEQKRFCFQHLKTFGFGSKSMETFIQNEIKEVIENWASFGGKPFSPNKSFYLPVLNTLWVILTGERASTQNQRLLQLVQPAYEGFGKCTGFPDVLALGSKLSMKAISRIMNWTPFFPGVKLMANSLTGLHSYFRTSIDARKKSDADLKGTPPKNLVDAYRQQINKTSDPDSEFYGQKGETHLLALMTEFFMAGGDTTATQLVWAVLHLVRNPEIQTQIQREIDSAVGNDRSIALSDRINCPLLEAFLWEVLRFNPLSTLSLPHAATEDTHIGPYSIEKGTLIFLNIYSILNDPRVWGDPETFRPQRFLSEDRKTVLKYEAMCSFSVGLRRCFGEQLARDELFLFVGAICQRFMLKPDPILNGKFPTIREDNSLLLIPQKFNVVAIDRCQQ